MNRPHLALTRSESSLEIQYDNKPMVLDLGAGIPVDNRWLWTFDGSLRLVASQEDTGSDLLGDHTSLALTYADETDLLVRQAVKWYEEDCFVVVETTALRELRGTAQEDSFFATTLNSPVIRPADGLSYLVYTWGLLGGEGTGVAGHFPDVALARDLAELPEKLRLADFSPTLDVHYTSNKPFAPLIGYDSQERTMVMSPLNHFLVSPMRLLETPEGTGVARGLHGAVDVIPAGTTPRTILTFGTGLVPTVLKWGELLLRSVGKMRGKAQDSLVARSLGFWNCYGGYYAELFRPTTQNTLDELAEYFQESDLPIRYWGLDLWYEYSKVGFVSGYRPQPAKYPEGLKPVFQSTGIPFLLHMSAFEQDNLYLDRHHFVVDEGASYPTGPELFRELAEEFKDWGATGVWHDFLRTQLQNCRSLRERVGPADQWLDNLANSMAEHGLDVMLCMPTVGHYLASVAYDNVVAVRTSTDYVNHQPGQLERLSQLKEYRTEFSPQRNLRQNLMLSFLAGALGLAPSHDVFISNREHPEGFANPHADRDALMRALSAGIVGLGDKLGYADPEVAGKLAFPDGTLAQPDHPPYPLASTLHSDVTAFYSTTSVSGYCWTYLVLINLTDVAAEYRLDLGPFLQGTDSVVYDYYAKQVVVDRMIAGSAAPGEGRYLVIVPRVGKLYPLGFLDKYVPVSGRQVKAVDVEAKGIKIDLELRPDRNYTFAVVGTEGLAPSGRGVNILGVERSGELTIVEFRAGESQCSLWLVE